MTLPLTGAATSAIKSLGSAVQHGVIDATLSTPGQIWTYVVGNKFPINAPSVETVLQSYTAGLLNARDTAAVARWQGADVPIEGRMRTDAPLGDDSLRLQRCWQSVLASMETVLSTEAVVELYMRGVKSADDARAGLRRNGVVSDQVAEDLLTLAKQIPGESDIINAYMKGILSELEAESGLAKLGINLNDWLPYIDAKSATISPNEAIEYGLRLGATRDEIGELMIRSGVFDSDQREAMITLYAKIPTRGDISLWLQRNVFDQEYVTDFRLDEGFEERYWARFGTLLETSGWSKDYAYLDYAAHWIVPATSQLAEMVQRLRPGRVDQALQYTAQDFERTLAEQDYAPFYRSRLLAISYRPLPIRFIRAAYQTNSLAEEGVSESYQDQGYSKDVAEFMAETERVIKARARASQSRGWTPQALAKAYVSKQTDAGNVRFHMQELGFTDDEAKALLERAESEYAGRFTMAGVSKLVSLSISATLQGFAAGTLSESQAVQALISAGYSESSAVGVVNATDMKVRTQGVMAASKAIRKSYLRGEVNQDQAMRALMATGMVVDRAAQQIALWNLELTPRRKELSASAIRKGVLTGIITEEQALISLRNIGYDQPDAALLVTEYVSDLTKQLNKVGLANRKNSISAGNLLEKLLAYNAKLETKMRNALRRATPVGKLEKWLKAGIIDEDFFRHRMSLMGYDDGTIERYIRETSIPTSSRKGSQAAQATGQEASPTVSP